MWTTKSLSALVGCSRAVGNRSSGRTWTSAISLPGLRSFIQALSQRCCQSMCLNTCIPLKRCRLYRIFLPCCGRAAIGASRFLMQTTLIRSIRNTAAPVVQVKLGWRQRGLGASLTTRPTTIWKHFHHYFHLRAFVCFRSNGMTPGVSFISTIGGAPLETSSAPLEVFICCSVFYGPIVGIRA